MQTQELPYARLSYRPDLRVLFLRWKRAASSVEHRAGYEAALRLARETKAGWWQVDLRSRGLASADDFGWVLKEICPRLAAYDNGYPHRIAYLVMPSDAEVMQQRLRSLTGPQPTSGQHEVELRIFTEEHAAQQWLHSGSLTLGRP